MVRLLVVLLVACLSLSLPTQQSDSSNQDTLLPPLSNRLQDKGSGLDSLVVVVVVAVDVVVVAVVVAVVAVAVVVVVVFGSIDATFTRE